MLRRRQEIRRKIRQYVKQVDQIHKDISDDAAPMRKALRSWRACDSQISARQTDIVEKACQNCIVRQLAESVTMAGSRYQQLIAQVRRTHFAPRKNLFSQGAPVAAVQIVTSGVVRFSRALLNGQRQVLGFALPGDLLDASLSPTHDFSADAVDQVLICQTPREVFTSFVESEPWLVRRLNDMLIEKLRCAEHQMAVLGHKSALERVACFLFNLHSRWAKVDPRRKSFSMPMLQSDIADFLGLTIETVNRMLAQLVREGVIARSGTSIQLLNPGRIEELALT